MILDSKLSASIRFVHRHGLIN